MLTDSEKRVNCNLLNHLLDVEVEISGDELFPLHHNEYFKASGLNTIGHVCIGSTTIRESF